jgi:hypothetical protein
MRYYEELHIRSSWNLILLEIVKFSSEDLMKKEKKRFEKEFVWKRGEHFSFQNLSKICINLLKIIFLLGIYLISHRRWASYLRCGSSKLEDFQVRSHEIWVLGDVDLSSTNFVARFETDMWIRLETCSRVRFLACALDWHRTLRVNEPLQF